MYGILEYFERGRSMEARNGAEAGQYGNVSRDFQTLKQAIFCRPCGRVGTHALTILRGKENYATFRSLIKSPAKYIEERGRVILAK